MTTFLLGMVEHFYIQRSKYRICQAFSQSLAVKHTKLIESGQKEYYALKWAQDENEKIEPYMYKYAEISRHNDIKTYSIDRKQK